VLLIFFNFLMAGIPSFAVLVFLARRNRRLREPSRSIIPAFFAGFLAVIPALTLELVLRPYEIHLAGIVKHFFKAFLIIALVEEGSKFLAVKLFFYRKRDFRRISDGVVLALAAGMGFAFFENIFFSFSDPSIFLLRGMTSVPLHAAASGILGYYVGLSKFSHRPCFGKGLLVAISIHGFYDFLLFFDSWIALVTLPSVLLSLGVMIRLYRSAVEKDEEEGRMQVFSV